MGEVTQATATVDTARLSREDITKKFKDDSAAVTRGRELRKKGYRISHHPIWGDSVETPSQGFFDETRMKVRYTMDISKGEREEIEESFEYLVLYQEVLQHVPYSNLGFVPS